MVRTREASDRRRSAARARRAKYPRRVHQKSGTPNGCSALFAFGRGENPRFERARLLIVDDAVYPRGEKRSLYLRAQYDFKKHLLPDQGRVYGVAIRTMHPGRNCIGRGNIFYLERIRLSFMKSKQQRGEGRSPLPVGFLHAYRTIPYSHTA